MNNFTTSRFAALLKREVWEHKGQIIYAPAVVAVLFFISLVWIIFSIGAENLGSVTSFVSITGTGLDITAFMLAAIPFAIVIPFYSALYLLSSLYQERKDLSIFFWQSMPVSDAQTVISKIVTVCLVVPLIATGIIFSLYVLVTLLLAVQGVFVDGAVSGIFQSLASALNACVLIFLTMINTALWFFPTIGWILLFSAFARNVPMLWAVGVFILLLLLEDFIFSTQFLANWANGRTNVSQYPVWSVPDFFSGLMDYDLLIGVVLGAMLVAGAVYMRRFVD